MTAPELRAATEARPASLPSAASRWTVPILRVGMAVFLVAWGLDKLVAVDGSQRIFERFYRVAAGPSLVQLTGAAEIVLALLLAAGVVRRPIAWVVLIVNAASTLASWRQILDPWGRLGFGQGGTHLFLASIVIMAVSVVLVLNAGDDTHGRRPPPARSSCRGGRRPERSLRRPRRPEVGLQCERAVHVQRLARDVRRLVGAEKCDDDTLTMTPGRPSASQ